MPEHPMLRGIADRLHVGLRSWRPESGEPDKKSFTQAMADRFANRGGQKGVSYQTVLSYFDGVSVPTLEWLAEAADVLGVRFEWLALNVGPQYRGTAELVLDAEANLETIRERALSGLPFLLGELPPEVEETLLDAAVRLAAWENSTRAINDARDPVFDVEDAVGDIIALAWAPLSRFELSHMSARRFGEFALAILVAIRLAVPDGDGVRSAREET